MSIHSRCHRMAIGAGAVLVALTLLVPTAFAQPTPTATATATTTPVGSTSPTGTTTTSPSTTTSPAATGTITPTPTVTPTPAASGTTAPTPTVTPTAAACGTLAPTPTVTGSLSPTPTSSVPHDSRYFSQTGFRVDNDTIWDYFNRRGGINVFGYPVSRTFTFQGFTVQFFQRRIVQLGPDGHARLLNMLDPGLMPYNSFCNAVMPTYDNTLVGTAPSPTNQAATLAWIHQHAPDSFQGLPVNFYQTFINSVSYPVAFPNGGNPGLLPGLDLELWGIPTSNPTFDPNNHNFVYQRFQRGIMMYDAGCNCTHGVLLADYFKGVLTGQNLPLDLSQEAQASPFLMQYDPSMPGWVHNPSLLPNTDLANAFTPE